MHDKQIYAKYVNRISNYEPGRAERETGKWRRVVEFGIPARKSRHDNVARIRVLQEFICRRER